MPACLPACMPDEWMGWHADGQIGWRTGSAQVGGRTDKNANAPRNE
jgi:hypothetical protein